MIEKIFENNMTEVNDSSVAVVDFSATWCGPCKMLEPVIEELSDEMSDQADFFSADVDENSEICKDFGIQSVPTVVVMKNGQEVGRSIGFLPKETLRDFIEKNI